MKNTTLCYIEQNGQYLMMHRTKKVGDCNKDKWIGIGGHLEEYESPYDCILREAREETGLILTDCTYRGLVSFCSPQYETEQMHLFSAHHFEGTLLDDCTEGDLEWISEEKLMGLPMWEGDRIFLRLLPQNVPFFLLKLIYDAEGNLLSHDLRFCGDERKPLLISACLLGSPCRYDGLSKPLSDETVSALAQKYLLIPVCAEILGGLATPRIPAEISANGKVIRRDGADVTEEYLRGAKEVVRYAEIIGAQAALLKARSPSCGCGKIYDGTYSNTLRNGNGITAQHLLDAGIAVCTEENLEVLGIYENDR